MTGRLPEHPEVVIVGGGVAAVEALIGLRELAGDRVRLTLVASGPDFVYRPMQVAEPFGGEEASRHPLGRIATDFDARLVRAHVASIDAAERRIAGRGGTKLDYDVLVLAAGARALPAFDEAITFGLPGAGPGLRDALAALERGQGRRIAFVVPTLAGWALPLYELALMTAAWSAGHDVGADVRLITPEERPLGVFGDGPSATVARLLADAGIEFVGSTWPDSAGQPVDADYVVSLPLIRGPHIEGVPTEPDYGFIPVDRHGRVSGLDDVYAAGDATDFPIKQGGLAAQQADAVAEHIAARAGAPVDPAPFEPVLRGMLLTGEKPRFLLGNSGTLTAPPLWQPAAKIAGRYLAPYVAQLG